MLRVSLATALFYQFRILKQATDQSVLQTDAVGVKQSPDILIHPYIRSTQTQQLSDVTMVTQTDSVTLSSPPLLHNFHIITSFLPTFTVLPAYIQCCKVCRHGPMGVECCGGTVSFQQKSLLRLSDLTVGVELSSYLQSFTAAPFQLHSADWLCQHAEVPEVLAGEQSVVTAFSDPDFLGEELRKL